MFCDSWLPSVFWKASWFCLYSFWRPTLFVLRSARYLYTCLRRIYSWCWKSETRLAIVCISSTSLFKAAAAARSTRWFAISHHRSQLSTASSIFLWDFNLCTLYWPGFQTSWSWDTKSKSAILCCETCFDAASHQWTRLNTYCASV